MNKFIVVEVIFALVLTLSRLSKGRLLLIASKIQVVMLKHIWKNLLE